MASIDEIVANRKAWLEALRSGEFRQGTGYLCQNDPNDEKEDSPLYFCCLGVACEKVLGLTRESMSKDGVWRYETGGEYPYIDTEFCFEQRNALGLSDDNVSALIEMNDAQCASFEEIANFIETLPIWEP